MATLYAGTSGFAYPSWRPDFYPEKLPAGKFLSHYATRLNVVEINFTFRRLASEKVVDGWMAATPASFLIAVKAHMRITHIHRLRNAGEALQAFFRSVNPLAATARLGPVLFQLPPNLKRDDGLLAGFLADLPRNFRHVLEVRHESWFDPAVLAALSEQNVALCRAETDRLTAPAVVTADFVYFRFRKAEYPAEERARLAEHVREHLAAGRDVFAIFKHEDDPAGAQYALELLRAAGGS